MTAVAEAARPSARPGSGRSLKEKQVEGYWVQLGPCGELGQASGGYLHTEI